MYAGTDARFQISMCKVILVHGMEALQQLLHNLTSFIGSQTRTEITFEVAMGKVLHGDEYRSATSIPAERANEVVVILTISRSVLVQWD